MPLYRRVPKRGFNNYEFRKVVSEVKLSDLEAFENGTEVTAELLKANGIIKKINDGIVILGNGNLTKKLNVKGCQIYKNSFRKDSSFGRKGRGGINGKLSDPTQKRLEDSGFEEEDPC